jgi:hypothetical protein
MGWKIAITSHFHLLSFGDDIPKYYAADDILQNGRMLNPAMTDASTKA